MHSDVAARSPVHGMRPSALVLFREPRRHYPRAARTRLIDALAGIRRGANPTLGGRDGRGRVPTSVAYELEVDDCRASPAARIDRTATSAAGSGPDPMDHGGLPHGSRTSCAGADRTVRVSRLDARPGGLNGAVRSMARPGGARQRLDEPRPAGGFDHERPLTAPPHSAVFSASANPSPLLRYQWAKDP
jgi:hypothetical protein